VKPGLMTPEQFKSYVAWSDDKYYFFEGAGPADKVGSPTTVYKDFNT